MSVPNLKTIGLFVDISNLYYCIGKKFPGRKLNFSDYLAFATAPNVIYCAKAYGIEVNNEAAGFKTCLKYYGYDPIYKSPKIVEVNGKTEYRKTSWNVGLSMDVVRCIDKLDVIIIGSSDPELASLVDWIKQHGRECVVVACGISKELKIVANSFKEITEELLKVGDAVTEAAQPL